MDNKLLRVKSNVNVVFKYLGILKVLFYRFMVYNLILYNIVRMIYIYLVILFLEF